MDKYGSVNAFCIIEGLRTSKAVDYIGDHYCYEYDRVVKEIDDWGMVAYNVYGAALISRELNGQKSYYFYNGHGDVTMLFSAAGEANPYRYAPATPTTA